MSLKARIEAVIYAAEEPVTLPQLAAIFRDEAVASRAARLAPTVDPEPPAEPSAEPVVNEPVVNESDAPESEAIETIVAELLPPEPDAQASVPAPEAVSRFEAAEAAVEPAPESPSEAPEADLTRVPSEPAAQNSSDAEVAVPDVEGEPQPFPNEPAEATTPGRENDAGLPPDAQRPDHADQPATNALDDAEAPSDSEPEPEPAAAPGTAEKREAQSAERVVPEGAVPERVVPQGAVQEGAAQDERKAARQRDREVREEIRRLIDELIAEYAAADRGVEIREIAGGFRMATRAEYHDAVRAFVRSLKPPMKLSLQALETLAVIAYKQPVTAPEIGEIRGVDSGGVLGSLVARKLVTTAGRKQVIGRPILYKTTKEFLLRFGLRDLNELPSLEEFEKMASELAEPEEGPAAEQIPFAQNEMAEIEEAEEEESLTEAADSEAELDTPAPEAALPAAEPEVGAAASEPAEARNESQPEPASAARESEENPEPALAGAETDPAPTFAEAPAFEEDVAATPDTLPEGPGDGDPEPPPASADEQPAAASSEEGRP